MKLPIAFMALLSIFYFPTQDDMKEISKNKMTVKWKIDQEFIHFDMEAPTDGWVAIGFNETASLAGTYLLMGRIRNGKAEIVEHYTNQPGSYKPIAAYGITNQVLSITGNEIGSNTRLRFTIPISAASKYHKDLLPDTNWSMLIAYSVADDFQHHSIMRTSVNIKL